MGTNERPPLSSIICQSPLLLLMLVQVNIIMSSFILSIQPSLGLPLFLFPSNLACISMHVVLVCFATGLLCYWSGVLPICCATGLLCYRSLVLPVCCATGLLLFSQLSANHRSFR